MNLGSRFDLSKLNKAKTAKGSKTANGDIVPMMRFTPTLGKIRFNTLAMKALDVSVGDFVNTFDLGNDNNEFGARFLIRKSAKTPRPEGFKIGKNRYISIASLYNAAMLNEDGVETVSAAVLKAKGIFIDYPVVIEGTDTGKMATGSTRILSYELEQLLDEDEDGNVIDKFILDPDVDLEPVAIFKLVNRVESPFSPGNEVFEDED